MEFDHVQNLVLNDAAVRVSDRLSAATLEEIVCALALPAFAPTVTSISIPIVNGA